ncbi:hypothetical protein COOONC_14103 [Cooperia oncophora]
MTENRLQEVYLGNMEASVVDALVKFCYSGEINISNANVLNILSAARLFQLDQVEELCREFLKKKLEPSSSLVVRPVTDSISCPEADENVLHNFENAVNTEKAHEILVNQLVELILNEELSVTINGAVGGYGHASGEYFDPGEKFPRYAGVAALDDLLYVVGGLSDGKL